MCQDAEVDNVIAGSYFTAVKKSIGYGEEVWLCVGIYGQLASAISSASSDLSESASSDSDQSDIDRSDSSQSQLTESSESPSEDSRSEDSQTEESKSEDSRSEESKSEASRSDGSKSEKSKSEKSKSEKSQSDASQSSRASLSSDSSRSEESRSDDSQASSSEYYSSISSRRSRSSESSSVAETGCPDCCASIAERYIWYRISGTGDQGTVSTIRILSHKSGCEWESADGRATIKFCYSLLPTLTVLWAYPRESGGEQNTCTIESLTCNFSGWCVDSSGYLHEFRVL
jgi:hypothetical protein